ncbi:MAG: hypothetical protein J5J06_10470 [Phycisphaerae bacterium]|nr:hypothetical protein [Phycisphaerae bacterium]
MSNRLMGLFLLAISWVLTALPAQETLLADDGVTSPTSRPPLTRLDLSIDRKAAISSHAGSRNIKTVSPAEPAGLPLAAAPANDACASATPINGTGQFPFDNSLATTDGLDHAACEDPVAAPGVLGISRDVWFCWTAACSGAVRVDTCGAPSVDTRVAVYTGCTCPGTDARIQACNDDSQLCAGGLQSSVDFLAESGQTYLIRVGSYPGASGGPGNLNITCLDQPCQEPAARCQGIDYSNGRLSDGSAAASADNFRPAVSGSVSEVCFWGSYDIDEPQVDQFRITYYSDQDGLPGSVIGGPFVQDSTLTVSPAVLVSTLFFPVFEYTAVHTPVAVSAGQCYWIEIVNTTSASPWYWQLGFDGDNTMRQDDESPLDGYDESDLVRVDTAFCLNIDRDDADLCPPPPNSTCGVAAQDCCTEDPSGLILGCEDGQCCRRVCACDDFCCTVAWDDACAGKGSFGTASCTASRYACIVNDDCRTCCNSGLPCLDSSDCDSGEQCVLVQRCEGCGASERCGDLCRSCPNTTINWMKPLVGGKLVDARTPYDMLPAPLPEGLDRFNVGAALDVTYADCWSLCETGVDCAASKVADVIDNLDNTYLVQLSRPATVRETTKITYTSDTLVSQSMTIISHPGNVNASAKTTVEDLIAMIDRCQNEVALAPHGEFSCDIDHSGTVTVTDIPALIALFNAGALDTPIPPNTCP